MIEDTSDPHGATDILLTFVRKLVNVSSSIVARHVPSVWATDVDRGGSTAAYPSTPVGNCAFLLALLAELVGDISDIGEERGATGSLAGIA